jgi:hydrogenase/urease accessory protein HupE
MRLSRLVAGLASLLCNGIVHAHEIGTTRVSATFQEGRTYDVEIVTDATALAEKLAVSAGSGFEDKFRQRVKVAFDGAEVRPQISYSVEPPIDALSAAAATIHLTGQIPEKAQNFTWNFGWTFATYAMTAGGATQWLEGGETSAPLALASLAPTPNRIHTAWRYLRLGFTHIVPYGLDHMLFVLGIYLLSRRARSVLLQVSAFTVAHSITLGLSMYGLISVPPRIVEPMIAISIAYVAIENIFLTELKSWRIALVFAFGLLHGMGFAGALKELGLPRSEFVTALLTFNVGVEAGQLAVIATAFLLVGWHCAHRDWYRSRVVVPSSMLIACTAIYWTIERLSLFA